MIFFLLLRMNYLITIVRLRVQMLYEDTFRQCFAEGFIERNVFNKATKNSVKMVKWRNTYAIECWKRVTGCSMGG